MSEKNIFQDFIDEADKRGLEAIWDDLERDTESKVKFHQVLENHTIWLQETFEICCVQFSDFRNKFGHQRYSDFSVEQRMEIDVFFAQHGFEFSI